MAIWTMSDSVSLLREITNGSAISTVKMREVISTRARLPDASVAIGPAVDWPPRACSSGDRACASGAQGRRFDSYQAHFQDATRATFRVKQAVSRQAMRCACGVSKRIFLAVGTIVEPRREEQHGPGAITNQPRAHEAMREVGSLVVPRCQPPLNGTTIAWWAALMRSGAPALLGPAESPRPLEWLEGAPRGTPRL